MYFLFVCLCVCFFFFFFPSKEVRRRYCHLMTLAVLHSTIPNFRFLSGMSSRLFRGFHNIQEVACTGKTLPTGSSLYALVLYEKKHDRITAIADFSKKQCFTSGRYASCDLDAADPKQSLLRSLDLDLAEGQSRTYGCNASFMTSAGRFRVFSWSIRIRRASKWAFRRMGSTRVHFVGVR